MMQKKTISKIYTVDATVQRLERSIASGKEKEFCPGLPEWASDADDIIAWMPLPEPYKEGCGAE